MSDNPDTTRPSISVLTVARNAEATIEELYESLKRQTYDRFEWVVMDGRSEDSTARLLRRFSAESSWVRATSEPDFGIYDALNKAVAAARARYYVVAGADDLFARDALTEYAEVLAAGEPDVVLARVSRSGRTRGGFCPRRAWIGHSKAFRGSHSVGMLFRKSLHEEFGMYSKRFPMLADGYFLKRLLRAGVNFVDADFVAGSFSDAGISSVSTLQTLAETWQIQMLTEPRTLLQTCLFIGKLLYRYPALAQEVRAANRRNK